METCTLVDAFVSHFFAASMGLILTRKRRLSAIVSLTKQPITLCAVLAGVIAGMIAGILTAGLTVTRKMTSLATTATTGRTFLVVISKRLTWPALLTSCAASVASVSKIVGAMLLVHGYIREYSLELAPVTVANLVLQIEASSKGDTSCFKPLPKILSFNRVIVIDKTTNFVLAVVIVDLGRDLVRVPGAVDILGWHYASVVFSDKCEKVIISLYSIFQYLSTKSHSVPIDLIHFVCKSKLTFDCSHEINF
jgi:hypothetical protein